MRIRNAVRLDDKRINCEVEHHELGWLPFTAGEDGDIASVQVYARCLNGEAGDIAIARAEAVSYTRLRRAEYPPIEEQLDAIWKGGEDMEIMRQRIMAVKARYPEEIIK